MQHGYTKAKCSAIVYRKKKKDIEINKHWIPTVGRNCGLLPQLTHDSKLLLGANYCASRRGKPQLFRKVSKKLLFFIICAPVPKCTRCTTAIEPLKVYPIATPFLNSFRFCCNRLFARSYAFTNTLTFMHAPTSQLMNESSQNSTDTCNVVTAVMGAPYWWHPLRSWQIVTKQYWHVQDCDSCHRSALLVE